MKVLLIGLGRWGEQHLRVLRELGTDPWVADVNPERQAVARRAGIVPSRVVADFRLALPHVEAVDVVTPADSHLALAGEALRAGKACFLEKPLTLTVAEGQELAGIVRDTGRLLQVGHIFRFHPVTEVLRRLLDAGDLGRVRYATARFAGFKRPRTDVGVTRADALHCYDLLAYLLRVSPTAVTATLRDHLGRGMDDCSFSVVEYGPVPALVEVGYFAPPTSRHCVIVGERAAVTGDFAASEVRLHTGRHVPVAAGWEATEGPTSAIKAEGPEPLRRELAQFLDAVAGRRPSPVDVGAGLLALCVVEAAERSSQLGRRVALGEVAPLEAPARHLEPAGRQAPQTARAPERAEPGPGEEGPPAPEPWPGWQPVLAGGEEGTKVSPWRVAWTWLHADRERRLAQILLALWCVFIVYGSFMPFRFSFAGEDLRASLARAQVAPFADGRRAFSLPDVASNVLLFLPFGALLSLAFSPGRRRQPIVPIASAVVLAGGLATLIELGQLFAPGRISSAIDVAANMIGALLGAGAVALVWGAGEGRLASSVAGLVRREPLIVPIALLAGTLLAQATYPFAITLDVSTVWSGFKGIEWVPFQAAPRSWGDLLVNRALCHALLGGLVVAAVRTLAPRRPALAAAAGLAVAFAVAVELSKLLFAGRVPSVENAAVATAAGLLGVAAIPPVARWAPIRNHSAAALAGLALLLLAYLQLAPFQFALDPASLQARLARVEWLPLRSYYGADFRSAALDLWRKLLVSGVLGFAVALGTGRGVRAGALAGLLAGAMLEAAQVATVSRHPDLTDVVVIGLGATIGAAAHARYRALRTAPSPD